MIAGGLDGACFLTCVCLRKTLVNAGHSRLSAEFSSRILT